MPYARRPSFKRKRTGYTRRAAATRIQSVYRKKRSLGLTRKIRRVALSLNETKLTNHLLENISLFHNAAFYQLGFLATEQGVNNPMGTSMDQNNRLGQEIMARGLTFKFFFMNKQDHSNVTYKLIIFSYDRETGDKMGNAAPGSQDQFFWTGPFNAGATQNRLLDRPNTTIRTLKTIMIHPKEGANVAYSGGTPVGLEHTYYRGAYVKLNKKVVYATTNGTTPKGRDIGFMMLAYDTYSTLQTDNIANFSYQATLTFKDP